MLQSLVSPPFIEHRVAPTSGLLRRKRRGCIGVNIEPSSVESHRRECNLCLMPKFKLPPADAAACYPKCEAPSFRRNFLLRHRRHQRGSEEEKRRRGAQQRSAITSAINIAIRPRPDSKEKFAEFVCTQYLVFTVFEYCFLNYLEQVSFISIRLVISPYPLLYLCCLGADS